MKFASKIVLSILCFQLAGGQALAQVGAVGAVGAAAGHYERDTQRSKTAKEKEAYPEVKNNLGELSKEELQIDSVEEADTYVKSFVSQADWFEDQCAVKKADGVHVKWDTSFVLHDNIPYSDMNIKNCGQEHEKLSHMYEVAKELSETFSPEEEPNALINKNCADCGPNGAPNSFLDDQSPDYVPPGDKCSLQVQAKVQAENCGVLKALGSAVTHWSCIGNLIKGVINGLRDAVVGIGKLLWEGVKWAGNKVKDGWNGLMVWAGFKKAETKADEGILAVSKKKQEEYKAFQKDKEGWLKRSAETIWNVIKEITYQGMYERESKCMNCKEKGDLLCEIGGRIFNDVVGFSFTLGLGAGAIATITKKVAGKLTDVTAKMTTRFAAAAEKGGRMNKIRNAAWKGAGVVGKKIKWVGNMPIRFLGKLGRGTMAMWKKFKSSSAFQAITNPANPNKVGKFLRWGTKKVANSIPAKIIITPVKWTGKQIGRYFRYDQRIFAKGSYYGARFGGADKVAAARLMDTMLPKLDKEAVTLDNNATRTQTLRYKEAGTTDGKLLEVADIEPNTESIVARLETRASNKGVKGAWNRATRTEGTALGGETKWRVWEVPESYLDAERRAEYVRAGIEIKDPVNGMYKLELPNSQFKKLFRKEFATKLDKKFGLPVGKDDIVVARYGDQVEQIPLDKMTKTRLKELREKGAIFTTKDHIGWDAKLNPHNIDPKYISANLQEQGKIAYVKDDKVYVMNARDVTQKLMKQLEDDQKAGKIVLIEGGLDNPQAISKWKNNKLVDQTDLSKTAAAENFQLGKQGKFDEKTEAAVAQAQDLNIILTRNADDAMDAQKTLSNRRRMPSSVFDEMHENFEVGYALRDKHLEVTRLTDDVPVKLPFKNDPKNPVVSVDGYQDGRKVIVRQQDGTAHVYDLTEQADEARLIQEIPKSESKRVATAMGEVRNGQLSAEASFDDVITNLKNQQKVEGTDFWVTRNKQTGKPEGLHIKMDPACGKGVISVSCAPAKLIK